MIFFFSPGPAENTGSISFLSFFFFIFFAIFCSVARGPQSWPCNYGVFHVIFLPRQWLTSWQRRQWQCVSLLSFYTFCFRMQDFLMVCLGFSKSLFTDPERCQTHGLKNAGQVYMCLKIHHRVQAHWVFGANVEADLIAVCSVLFFAKKKVAVNTGQNLSSLEPLVWGKQG